MDARGQPANLILMHIIVRSKYKNTKQAIHYTRTTSIPQVFIKLYAYTLSLRQ